MTTTTQILCPACRVNPTDAVSWAFSQTSVEVGTCQPCRMIGVVSVNLRVSGLAELYVPESTWRHQDGFVELGHKGRSWSGR